MKKLTLTIDVKLYEQLQKIAEHDARSVNNFLTIMIKRRVEQESKSAA